MAAGAVIGALRVVLGADTAQFEEGLKKAQAQLAGFGSAVMKSGAVVAAGVVAAAAGLGVAVTKSLHEADKLGKLAQSIGIPVEELSRLKHAADLSDVSIEALGKSVGILSKNMMAAAGDATSKQALAFKALGISVKDSEGNLKSSSAVITEVAEKFVGMRDGAGKTAIAMALFGKSGAAMIPMLNQGAAGLKEMMHEASELGIVITAETAQAAEGFNDNLRRLHKAADGVTLQIAAGMAPTLERVTGVMVATAKSTDTLKSIADALSTTLRNLVGAGVVVGAVFKAMGEQIGGVAGAIALVLKGEFDAAFERLKQGSVSAADTLGNAFTSIGSLWDAAGNHAEKAGKKIAAPIIASEREAIAAQKAIESFLSTQAKSIAGRNAEAAAVGMSAGARERLALVMQAEAIAQEKNLVLTDAQRIKITELANAARLAAMNLQGAQLTQEMLLPWDLYAQKITNLNALFQAGLINQGTYARAAQAAADSTGMSWKMASESISGSFTEIATAFGDSNSGIAKAAKIFGAATALINSVVAQSYALAGPFPANLVAVATIAAKGAAMVAAIRSASIPKMATGGSFTVPGGVGGPDSKFVPFMAHAGETVTVERPSQAGGSKREPREIVVKGWSVGQFLSFDGGRDLIASINASLGDGHKIKMA